MRKKVVAIMSMVAVVVFGVMLSGCQIQHHDQSEASSNEYIKETPLVVLHGTPADEHTWDTFVEDVKQVKGVVMEPLLRVSKDGEVKMEGKWQDGEFPVILLHFDNNNAPDHDQGAWLANVFMYLKRMGIRQVNFLGHSSGGVAMAYYLAEQQYKMDGRAVEINKVMTLGSPYNELDVDKNPSGNNGRDVTITNTLATIQRGFEDHHIEVKSWDNIAGNLNGKTDNIVPIGSVECLNPLLEEKHIPYEYKEMDKHSHSDLHETTEMLTMMKQYFFNQSTQDDASKK